MRGLRVFGRVRATNGEIRVQESSAVETFSPTTGRASTGPFVWLFHYDDAGEPGRASPHMTLAQAKRMRAVLDRFIAWAERRGRA